MAPGEVAGLQRGVRRAGAGGRAVTWGCSASPDRRDPLAGYRAALTAAGLPVSDSLVATVTAYHRRDGADAMRTLLATAEPPDAVFCFNDLLAVGALHTAAEHGLEVPRDLAVVGFDGSEEGAYTRPPLTTIAPDIGAIAEQAVGLLAGHADERAPTELVTPFSLRVRASTGAADGRR